MKRNPAKIIVLFLAIVQSCSNPKARQEKLWLMIKSDHVDSIIEATIAIGKANDTSMINALLYKANDPRITHRPFQKGMSVYQIKMTVLKRITKLDPPKKITYKVDTSIINFYRNRLKIYPIEKQ